MPTITVDTRIAAPIERCFDFARDVDAHVRSSAWTHERVVGGRMSGLLERGDIVTFEGVHFGIRQRFTARVVEMDRPFRLVDEMEQGAFARFRHVHEFRAEHNVVVMTDIIIWQSPFGMLGRVADAVFLEAHLTRFLRTKQAELKRLVEDDLSHSNDDSTMRST